jgi:hypothetical protein
MKRETVEPDAFEVLLGSGITPDEYYPTPGTALPPTVGRGAIPQGFPVDVVELGPRINAGQLPRPASNLGTHNQGRRGPLSDNS